MRSSRRRATPSACDGSFYNFVGAGEDRWRDSQLERLGRVEIYDQLEYGRLLHRQIGGLRTIEDTSSVCAGLAIGSRAARSIADQAARDCELALGIDCRNGTACCQRHELFALGVEERIAADEECLGLHLGESAEGGVDLAFCAGFEDMKLRPLGLRRILRV